MRLISAIPEMRSLLHHERVILASACAEVEHSKGEIIFN